MNKDVMTLTVVGLNVFARDITHDGTVYAVRAAGVNDAFEELDRVRSLLKDLVFNHVENDILNKIGISKEDLSMLGMSAEGIENINIPPRKEWYGE